MYKNIFIRGARKRAPTFRFTWARSIGVLYQPIRPGLAAPGFCAWVSLPL